MGVFWGTWFSLSRSIASIRPEVFLDIGQTMIGNLGRPMSLLMPAALLSSLVLLVLLFRQGTRAAFSLALAGVLLMVAALVITLAVNVPIDNLIKGWTATTLPAGWTDTRDRWEFYHGLRTFASICSVCCVVASALCQVPSRAAEGRRAG